MTETHGNVTVHIGDVRETLSKLPAESVQCVVTSPPYWGLRDYGNPGQLGLEPTPEEYVNNMVSVFREVRRVLKDNGTVWLNLGDSYAGNYSGGKMSKTSTSTLGPKKDGLSENNHIWEKEHPQRKTPFGLKEKDLVGIPWRVAFALQADGWYLRQDIIWHKPNPMPESVTDRCTKAHEYVFLLTKSARYYYDAEAVKEGSTGVTGGGFGPSKPTGTLRKDTGRERTPDNGARNRRSVWTVATQPYSGAHFATFPPKLIEPMILAGTSAKGQCPHCGAPWVRVVEKDGKYQAHWAPGKQTLVKEKMHGSSGVLGTGMINKYTTTGWQPSCTCPEHEPVPQTVLDPFGGSGTTAGVALEHGRKAVLCELSEEYSHLIPERINSITDALRQPRLFMEVTS